MTPQPTSEDSVGGGNNNNQPRPNLTRGSSTHSTESISNLDASKQFQIGYQAGMRNRLRIQRALAENGDDGGGDEVDDTEDESPQNLHSQFAQADEDDDDSDKDDGDTQLDQSIHQDGDRHKYDDDNKSVESFTLRERQDAINEVHPFGIRIWKPALYKKIRSVQKAADTDIHARPGMTFGYATWIGNILWTLIFGIPLFIICICCFLICNIIPIYDHTAKDYARTFLGLGIYLLFPFGKFVELLNDENYALEDAGQARSFNDYLRWTSDVEQNHHLFFGPGDNGSVHSRNRSDAQPQQDNSGTGLGAVEESTEHDHLLGNNNNSNNNNNNNINNLDHDELPVRRTRLFGRGKWTFGRIVFYFCFYILLCPFLYLIQVICWFSVISVPMAKAISLLLSHLRRHPLALKFHNKKLDAKHLPGTVLLCTYRAVGLNYYKYTIGGSNIILVNLMAVVGFTIIDYFCLNRFLHIGGFITHDAFVFTLALLSVIPLAHFIGQAVASISAQTSMGMGAAINAFFSTIIEVYLYTVALTQGKGALVEGSVVGSIFAGILVMPGLSMCSGALKRKVQRYNPRSAGVSSTMLMFAIIACFAPTLFRHIFGNYETKCGPCPDEVTNCKLCHFYQPPLQHDLLYKEVIRPFSFICAALLFLSYVIGLWFTLRTHAAIIWEIGDKSDKPPQTKTFILTQPADSSGTATLTNVPSTVTLPANSNNSLRKVPLSHGTGLRSEDTQSERGVGSSPQQDDHGLNDRRINLAGKLLHKGSNSIKKKNSTSNIVGGSSGRLNLKDVAKHAHVDLNLASLSPEENEQMRKALGDAVTNAVWSSIGKANSSGNCGSIHQRRTTAKPPSRIIATGGGGGDSPSLTPMSSLNIPPQSSRQQDQQQQQQQPLKRTTSEISGIQSDLPAPTELISAIDAEENNEHSKDVNDNGHDAPNWSRQKSTVILLGATILYAIVAEILVDTVDVVLENVAIPPKFLGITLFALVPNTTEFVNAISFALNGNIALSMEIGSAYALQVCLLQVPALVIVSEFTITNAKKLGISISDCTFSLVFPRWDLITVILCLLLFSYIYAEGRSNYFKGSILLLAYIVVLSGFYFTGLTDEGRARSAIDGGDYFYQMTFYNNNQQQEPRLLHQQ